MGLGFSVNLINRHVHGILDYVVGILLVLSPRLFGFHHGGLAQAVPIVLGGAAIVYSLLTDYELGVFQRIPFRVHLTLDLLSGIFLTVSPWVLGFADRFWAPHFILGLVEIGAVLMTRREPSVETRSGSTGVHW